MSTPVEPPSWTKVSLAHARQALGTRIKGTRSQRQRRRVWMGLHQGQGVGIVYTRGERYEALSPHVWVSGGTPRKVFDRLQPAQDWCWGHYLAWVLKDAAERLGADRG